jgi:hypothetical protein
VVHTPTTAWVITRPPNQAVYIFHFRSDEHLARDNLTVGLKIAISERL